MAAAGAVNVPALCEARAVLHINWKCAYRCIGIMLRCREIGEVGFD